jgi:hypothetical protein
MTIWYIFSGFGSMLHEKSGNLALHNRLNQFMPDFATNLQQELKTLATGTKTDRKAG